MNRKISVVGLLGVINAILIIALLFLWWTYQSGALSTYCYGSYYGPHDQPSQEVLKMAAGKFGCGLETFALGFLSVLILPFTGTAWAIFALRKTRKEQVVPGQPLGVSKQVSIGVKILILLIGLAGIYFWFTFKPVGFF